VTAADVTAVLDSVSYADMAAYVVAVTVTVAAVTVLWLLGRCTLRTTTIWALCLLVPLAACSAEDPDPCDNPDGTCANVAACGETGTCNGE
jgi:hypothetical protein